MEHSRKRMVCVAALMLCTSWWTAPLGAQAPSYLPPSGQPTIGGELARDYVIGAHDVLTITSHDDPTLSGRFSVEADLTFTYPLIGRVRAGGRTLRQIEGELQNQLVVRGFFKEPQILVAMEKYQSQKIFVVGEVRTPGAYAMTGAMRLIEALALAGSTLPTAAGEVVIVPAGSEGMVMNPGRAGDPSPDVTRVSLRELQNGAFSQNVALKGGDTVFVLRAQNIYVFGHVRNPGAYPLQEDVMTVLQGLSLAGGVTDRGATSRVEIVRTVDGAQKKVKVKLDDTLLPGDTIVVPERFF